jgi:hypothetical protein
MKRNSIWKTSGIIFGIFAVLFGAYYGYSALKTGEEEVAGTGEKGAASETVAQFKDEGIVHGHENVGDFIDNYHKKYNKSLGWGGIDSIDWTEQQRTAKQILEVMAEVQTEHPALQKDLEKIHSYAQAVESGAKDKQNLLKLHRYFHDLDVEFNSYGDTRDYYNVTEYKSDN